MARLVLALLIVCAAILPVKMTLLGGATNAEVDSSAEQLAEFATAQLNNKNDVNGPLSLVEVVSYKKQVVAGTNHIFTLKTTNPSGDSYTYTVTVFEKLPSSNSNSLSLELTKYHLEPQATE